MANDQIKTQAIKIYKQKEAIEAKDLEIQYLKKVELMKDEKIVMLTSYMEKDKEMSHKILEE